MSLKVHCPVHCMPIPNMVAVHVRKALHDSDMQDKQNIKNQFDLLTLLNDLSTGRS